MDVTETQTQIDRYKVQLTNLDTAVNTLLGGAASYTFDSGQTRQVVTRSNLTELMNAQVRLSNQICVLQSRLTGSGTSTAFPGW